MCRSCSLTRRRAGGVAMVEFAIIAPLLLIIFLGIAELGRALLLEQQLVRSVEAGARYLARSYTGLDPAADCAVIATALGATGMPSGAAATAVEVTVYGQESGGTTVLVPGMATGDVAISVNAAAIPGDADACVIRVGAEVGYRSLIGTAIPFNLNAASEERYVGE